MEAEIIDLVGTTHQFTINSSPSSTGYETIVVTIYIPHNDKAANDRAKLVQNFIKPFIKESEAGQVYNQKLYEYEYDAPDHDFILKSEAQIMKLTGIITKTRRVKKYEFTEVRFTMLSDNFTIAYGDKAMREHKINAVIN